VLIDFVKRVYEMVHEERYVAARPLSQCCQSAVKSHMLQQTDHPRSSS